MLKSFKKDFWPRKSRLFDRIQSFHWRIGVFSIDLLYFVTIIMLIQSSAGLTNIFRPLFSQKMLVKGAFFQKSSSQCKRNWRSWWRREFRFIELFIYYLLFRCNIWSVTELKSENYRQKLLENSKVFNFFQKKNVGKTDTWRKIFKPLFQKKTLVKPSTWLAKPALDCTWTCTFSH